MHRAITKLVGLAKRNRVPLRQNYLRLAKRAAIMVGRYTHAHQFKRARRQLKFLRTRLGRIIRDIRRKIDGDAALEARFGPLLDLAQRVRSQDQHQRGPKVYALHAPEVECIGKGAPFVDMDTASLHAGELLHVGDHGAERVPVEGIAVQRLGVEHELSALRRRHGGGDTDLAAELVRCAGLPRPQSPASVQGLDLGAGPPGHGFHPARDEASCGCRARHRPRQGRAPHGSQLSQRPRRRPHQRRPRRGRLQLRPAPALARSTLACHHPGARRNSPGSKHRLNHRASAFFTDD